MTVPAFTIENSPVPVAVDPAAIAAAEQVKIRIQSAYQMAVYNPRNFDQSRINILAACKRPAFAKKVIFRKPSGAKTKINGQWVDKIIEGPSVRFAELAIREWRNCSTETHVVFEDETARRMTMTVTDLETNASHTKEMVVRKQVERKKGEGRDIISERLNSYNEKVYLVVATDEEMQNKENAMISKILRNEGLRLIPADIIEEAIEVAKATMAEEDAKDPQAAKNDMLDAFASIGVTPLNIEEYLGHSSAAMVPAELENLRGMYRSIKDGDATWQQFVEPDDESDEDAKERVTKATAAKTADLVVKLSKTHRSPLRDIRPASPTQENRDHLSQGLGRKTPSRPTPLTENRIPLTENRTPRPTPLPRPVSPTQEEKDYLMEGLSEETPPPPPVTHKLSPEDSLVVSKFSSLVDLIGKNRAAEYFRKEHDCTMSEVTKNIPRMKAVLTDQDAFIKTVDLFITAQKKTAKPKETLL